MKASIIALVVAVAILGAKGHECPYLLTPRSGWHAAPPKAVRPFDAKPRTVLIKETARRVETCGSEIKAMQHRDMNEYGRDDIDCNVLFSAKALHVCEGRGWNNSVVGDDTLVFCVMYDSQQKYTYWTLDNGIENTLLCLLNNKILDPNYKVIALRDTNPSSLNPGYYLYQWITLLKRYKKANKTDLYNVLVKKEESTWFMT